MTPALAPQKLLSIPEADVLSAHLEDEIAVQDRLLEVLKRQEAALVGQDMVRLSACLAEASPVLERLEELTRKRARLFANLGRSLGFGSSEPRFSTFAPFVPAGHRARFAGALARLKSVLSQVGAQNRRNRMVVRVGQDVNQAVVRSLFGETPAPPTYDRAARARAAAPSRPWLSREV